MAMSHRARLALLAIGGYVALFALYVFVLHPWLMNWGSTADERAAALTGDEVVPNPARQTTRAITIEAPAAEVWAWLIQHGQDRAGFYSYDWLENLVGADIHNSDRLHPEWQTRAVGDKVPMSDSTVGQLVGDSSKLTVSLLEPGRALVLQDAQRGNTAYLLTPIDADTTRLTVRDRTGNDADGGIGRAVTEAQGWLIWDPMHFVMQRQMMLGIERRAEGHAAAPAYLEVPALLGWIAGGTVIGALYFRRRRWLPWLALPVAIALPAVFLGHDLNAALAGFLAIGITVLGALWFGRRWWAWFPLVFATVLLVLLLATNAYLVFGWAFLAIAAVAAGAFAYARSRGFAHRPTTGLRLAH